VAQLRIDADEVPGAQTFHIGRTELHAEPVAGSSFNISWTLSKGGPITITLGYDTDNVGYDGIIIATNLSGTSYTWNTACALTGKYYIYAIVDDGRNQTRFYSDAPVRVSGLSALPSPTASFSEPDGFSDTAGPGLSTYNVHWTGQNLSCGVMSLYYSTQANGAGRTLISNTISASARSYGWDTTGLSATTYYLFGSVTAGGPNYPLTATYPITIYASNPPNLSVSPTSFSGVLSRPNGVVTYTLSLSRTGTTNVDWNLSTTSGAVTITPNNGTVGSDTNVAIVVDPTLLPDGYTKIDLALQTNQVGNLTIPLNLVATNNPVSYIYLPVILR
jgi:hypothetical protein